MHATTLNTIAVVIHILFNANKLACSDSRSKHPEIQALKDLCLPILPEAPMGAEAPRRPQRRSSPGLVPSADARGTQAGSPPAGITDVAAAQVLQLETDATRMLAMEAAKALDHATSIVAAALPEADPSGGAKEDCESIADALSQTFQAGGAVAEASQGEAAAAAILDIDPSGGVEVEEAEMEWESIAAAAGLDCGALDALWGAFEASELWQDITGFVPSARYRGWGSRFLPLGTPMAQDTFFNQKNRFWKGCQNTRQNPSKNRPGEHFYLFCV